MGIHWDIVCKAGLQFFGQITASISHEIRNVLAVLNENAGLLEDLTLLAEKGVPINNERIKTAALVMKNQIQRADGIIKNLNTFSHSVDEDIKSVDVSETLKLVVAVSGRFADMRGVKLDPIYGLKKMHITTNPFFLENLLWCCLDFSMTIVGEGNTLSIITEELESGVQVRFKKLQGLAQRTPEVFPSEREKALLYVLEADYSADAAREEIVIALPHQRSR